MICKWAQNELRLKKTSVKEIFYLQNKRECVWNFLSNFYLKYINPEIIFLWNTFFQPLTLSRLSLSLSLSLCVCVWGGGGGGGGLVGCVQSRVKLQWHFICGFDFRNSLWLPFVAAFAVLKGLKHFIQF